MLWKNKGMLQRIIDPSMKDHIDENSLRKFSETIEKWLQEVGSDRPTMVDVLWDLEYALQLQTGVQDYSSSASLQLPNVQLVLSLFALSVYYLSIVRTDEFHCSVNSIFLIENWWTQIEYRALACIRALLTILPDFPPLIASSIVESSCLTGHLIHYHKMVILHWLYWSFYIGYGPML